MKNPMPVVAAITTNIVVVWLWNSSIQLAGLKPRGQDPKWLQMLVVVHNCFLCCLSVYMGYDIISEAHWLRYIYGQSGLHCFSPLFFSYLLPSTHFGYSSSEGILNRKSVSKIFVSQVDKTRYILIVNAWRTFAYK